MEVFIWVLSGIGRISTLAESVEEARNQIRRTNAEQHQNPAVIKLVSNHLPNIIRKPSDVWYG